MQALKPTHSGRSFELHKNYNKFLCLSPNDRITTTISHASLYDSIRVHFAVRCILIGPTLTLTMIVAENLSFFAFQIERIENNINSAETHLSDVWY